jgi:glutamate-1-semialdehyde 2,1-aminomutase
MASSIYVEKQLAEAHQHFAERNPRSQKAHQGAQQHLPGGNTRTVIHADPFPITWTSGKQARLTSLDGVEYIDLLGEFSAGIFGHSEPRIAKAVHHALENGWNFGGNNLLEKEFARKVCERFGPSGIDLVRFTNSGTESNTTCLAASLAITGRKKILVFSSGYHGSTLVFPMISAQHSTGPTMNLPHEFVYAPYNNITETREVIHSLPNDSLAAILVEPIQGSGGCRPAKPEFMQFLRETATSTGALLVIDEVMSSRLGPSGYSAKLGVKADFMTLGKYVGGGMTFGAFGGRKNLMALFDPSTKGLFHPGTYNNNVVSMSAGIVGLDIYNEAEVDRLNALGQHLKERVQTVLIQAHIYPKEITDPRASIIEVDRMDGTKEIEVDGAGLCIPQLPSMFITGQGSMLNIRFSGPVSQYWQALFYHHALSHNVFIATRGYTPLNLCLFDADVDKYVSVVRDFVSLHEAQLRGV